LDVVNQLVDVVEGHSVLHLRHNLSQRHFDPLKIHLALLLVLKMLDFLPLGLPFRVVLKDVVHSFWSVFNHDILDLRKPDVGGFVCELEVINNQTLTGLKIQAQLFVLALGGPHQ